MRLPQSQLLPDEKAAIIVDDVKQVGDLSKAIRFALAKKEAESSAHLMVCGD